MVEEVVRGLLSERDSEGRIPRHPYDKWRGAHWVLSVLADIGYPAEDEGLIPLREQVLDWLMRADPMSSRKRMNPPRACCSIQGNAVWYLLRLGLADERVDELVRQMLSWQWPDGGWNCDVDGTGRTSSFMETLIPLRALALYAGPRDQGLSPMATEGRPSRANHAVEEAVERAAEVFLSRRMFRRRSDGSVIHPSFLKLHYPCYWHYDILFGLRVMMEAGFLGDERCSEALSILESKRLADGGWPAEAKYYQVGTKAVAGQSLYDWGGTSTRTSNPWVTEKAVEVLSAAGRITGFADEMSKEWREGVLASSAWDVVESD